MDDVLRIAVCQTDIVWKDVEENLRRAESFVAAADADIVLLPEMFASGFGADVAPSGGVRIVAAMLRWAAQYDRAVVGSVAVADGDGFRNRMFFVEPSARTSWYDKRHLFRPGGEARAFVAGDRRTVVTYRGWRFLLLVCYDLRFPVWSRCRDDYDAILCCASWPASRREVWRTLLRARAIENQCCVAGANRVGADPAATYAGGSLLVDCYGRSIAEAGDCERTIVAEFDRSEIESFRRKFPARADADDFTLNAVVR